MLADQEAAGRLRLAREKAGYESASAAARALGIGEAGYVHHENGTRGFTRNAAKYARVFGVPVGWLLTGRGPQTGSAGVEIHGRIGAGALVTMAQDEAERASGEWFELPDPKNAWGFIVEGDSMRPAFYPGQIVVFSLKSEPEEQLVGQYCLVQMKNSGDRFVKILRRGRARDLWRLESHNADPIEDVELLGAYPWLSTHRPRDGRRVVVPETAKRARKPSEPATAARRRA